MSATDPMALKYLDNYYKTALGHRTMFSSGSAFKGFNDSLAAWGSNRIINQQCGQTWLKSMAENGKYYSATSQMLGIQIVTWNDYEEGSEIETGINNCVKVTASVSGTVVSWSITGQVNTIDHYSVFVSQDGENLMWLADTATSVKSMNLAQFTLNSGNYIVYVQAVGKPSLTNNISAGVQLTVANQGPRAVLSVTPASGTLSSPVTASAEGSFDSDGAIASTTISFGDGSAAVSGASALHHYNAAGTYTVKAVVTDNLGATASASQIVTINAAGGSNQPPVAALLLSAAAAYAPANISATTAGSSDPDGTIVGSAINFGDGSATTAGPSASHKYSLPGTYNVGATVTDNDGASSSTSRSITVKAPEVIVL
ncbi:MAG: PKD domain-containing protein, partial [Candidatus Angelobacter sp.]